MSDTYYGNRRTRKNRRCVGVLSDVPVNSYGDARLAGLLRLLRAVPREWVTKAQRIPVAKEAGLTDGELAELGRQLEIDPVFRRRFDADPVAAAEAAGMHEVASGLEREIRGLVLLAERIANDEVYRSELETDPVAALAAVGMPAEAAEPLLHALAVPGEVIAKLPEVVGHQHEQQPVRTRLLIVLLARPGVTEKIRAATLGA